MEELVDQIISKLKKEVTNLPEGFYDTFEYVTRGKNYVHPITWGILSKILSDIEGVKYVAVDFRLNLYSNDKRIKFQPDLVALSQIEPFEPMIFLDYESPNSSDMRIPKKDVTPYEGWSKANKSHVPYFIVTTLPNKPVKEWQLRYTTGTNSKFRGRRDEICRNPFLFWYEEYRKILSQKDLNMIYFINIDGKTVRNVTGLLQSDESLLSH